MLDDRETINKLVDLLNQGLADGILTSDQEENLRDEISSLQMNMLIGNLLLD